MNYNDLNTIANYCAARNFNIEKLNYDVFMLDFSNKIINKKIYTFNAAWCFTWRILGLFVTTVLFLWLLFNRPSNLSLSSVIYMQAILLILFVLDLVFLINKIVKSLSHNKKYKNAKKDIEIANTDIAYRVNEINKLSKQIASYNLIPYAYWYAGDKIVRYIINGRADTIKEAINLYEFELQNNMQFRMQMDRLNSISDSINNINRNTRINNAINALGFSFLYFK